MLLAVLVHFLLVSRPDGAQPEAGPVRSFGGKSSNGDVVFLLDLPDGRGQPCRVVSFHWREPGAMTNVELEKSPMPLDPYGLARPNDGTFWILGEKGRSVGRFDEASGKLVQWKALPEAASGIWNFGPLVVFAPLQFRGDEPLLAVEEQGRHRPFTRLKARRGVGSPETLALNLLECGFGGRTELPCWWLAGSSEILLIDENEAVRMVPAPSLIGPRPPGGTEGSTTKLDALITDLPYPIRDVLLLDRGSFWLLTNQEGSRSLAEQGAVRSRHVIRVEKGRAARTIELPKPGRAILGGDDERLLLLFRDGTIDWLSFR